MNRIVAIARLQVLGRRDGLLWPLVILGISFVVNLAIFAAAGDAFDGQPVTGGVASIYCTALAFGAVSIAQQFPFALGMSATRREFSAAVGLFVLAQTVLYAALLVLLQAVEEATGGWGLRMRFFGLGFIDHYGVPAQFAVYAVPMLCMSLLGIAFGTVYTRWRTNGVFAAVAALIVVLGGGAALLFKFDGWGAVGRWLAHANTLALFAGWPLALALLLGASSWFALRRATP